MDMSNFLYFYAVFKVDEVREKMVYIRLALCANSYWIKSIIEAILNIEVYKKYVKSVSFDSCVDLDDLFATIY